MVYHPQLRRPERLTIFRCYSKGSTFSLVILKPLSVVAVWGFNPQLPAQQECLHDVERNDTSTPKPVARQSNLLNLFPYSEAVRRAAKLQKKICLSDWHFSSPQYQRTLYIQLSYSCFLVTIFPPIVCLHFLHINTQTTHNSSNSCDERLTLETSAFKLFTVANLHYQLS